MAVESISNRYQKFFPGDQSFYLSRLQQIPNLIRVRCTNEIKSGNWDLSSFHHQLEISFSATNESYGTGSLFYVITHTILLPAPRFWGRIDHYENLAANCAYRTPLNNFYITLIKSILSYNNSLNDTAFHVGTMYFYIAKENGRRLRQNVNWLLKTQGSSLLIFHISRIINNPIILLLSYEIHYFKKNSTL